MRLYLLIFLLFLLAKLNAQVAVDSLLIEYNNTPQSIKKIELSIEIADRFVYDNPNKSIELCRSSLLMLEEFDNPILQAHVINRLGSAYWSKGNIEQALTYLNQSLDLSKELNELDLAAKNLGNLGNVYSLASDEVSAVSFYKQSHDYFIKSKNQKRIFFMLNNIGKSYLDRYEIDSASKYMTLAQQAYRDEFALFEAILFFNIADLKYKSGDYHGAEIQIDKALERAEKYNDNRAISRCNQLKSELLMIKNDFKNALIHAELAHSISMKTEVKELLSITSKTLSKAYSKNNEFKRAYEFFNLHQIYQDSLQSSLIKNKLDLFKHKEDKLAIELLESNAIARNRVIASMAAVILVTIIFMLVLINRRNKIVRQRAELTNLNNFKNKIFAVITHDLRSPIVNFYSLLDIISNKIASPEDLHKSIPSLKEKVNNLMGLMDNLFNWAKSNMDKVHIEKIDFNLKTVTDSVIDKLKPQLEDKNLSISNNIAVDLSLNSDDNLLTIVLRNFLVNAIKFSNQGKSIEISAEVIGDKAIVSVLDYGIGMSQEQIKHIFNYQSKQMTGTIGEQGTGLGLILCRDIVHKLGGEISIKSQLNKGSEFKFSFTVTK